MATTFSPPVRAKKKPKADIPVLPIALGAVAVALAALWFITNGKLKQAQAGSAALTDAVVQTAAAAGVEGVTVEALADATNGPVVLASVATSVGERVAELAAARSEVAQAKTNVGRLETEGQAAQEQLTTLRAQLDAARAEAKAKSDEATAAVKKAEAQVAALNATIAGLQEELAAAREAAAQAAVDEAVETAPVEETTGATAVDAAVAAEPAAVAEPVKPARSGSSQAAVIPEGKSTLFKTVRYDASKERLVFTTLDDKVLTYSGVPETTVDELLAAPVFDIYYRFRILDKFSSDPKDRDLIPTIRR